eukprot:m.99964 g.99964  ORF g.99964 m.99964 type:complete len:434 (+) comp15109_c0_seq1:185-1486(+)
MAVQENLDDFPWYHGALSRSQADNCLTGTSEGTYLIRESTSAPGSYVLSISESNECRHYKVGLVPEGFQMGGQVFRRISEIPPFYRRHKLETTCITEHLLRDRDLSEAALMTKYLFTAKALYDFTARDNDDLSFTKGDLLNILKKSQKDWWKAQSQTTLQIGFIPATYIEPLAVPERAPLEPPRPAKPKPTELARTHSTRNPVEERPPEVPPAMATAAPPPRPSRPKPAVPVLDEGILPQSPSPDTTASSPIVSTATKPTTKPSRTASAPAAPSTAPPRRPQSVRKPSQPATSAPATPSVEQSSVETGPTAPPVPAPYAASTNPAPAEPPKQAPVARSVSMPTSSMSLSAVANQEGLIVGKAKKPRAYQPYDSSALFFEKDDYIHVTRKEGGVWHGQVIGTDRSGHFPFTFVTVIQRDDWPDEVLEHEQLVLY